MTIVHRTLLLDNGKWDLVLEINGNIAVADAPYSIAQDVASALRTATGECWYDQANGIPYWDQILGYFPPLPYVKNLMEKQAKTVPNVLNATVNFTSFKNRQLQGECLVTTTDGQNLTVEFP